MLRNSNTSKAIFLVRAHTYMSTKIILISSSLLLVQTQIFHYLKDPIKAVAY